MRTGTNLQVAYFDQMREVLGPEATLADTITPGSEWVEIGGQRKHVMSYLGDFLFAPAARQLAGQEPVGRRAQPPALWRACSRGRPMCWCWTNRPTTWTSRRWTCWKICCRDYDGTVFLVSHDRRFVDNVVTSTIAWEGDDHRPGLWREYEGGIEDWLQQRDRVHAFSPRRRRPRRTGRPTSPPVATPAPTAGQAPRAKLSYKEQRELDELPGRIEALEAEQAALAALIGGAELYTQGAGRIAEVTTRHSALDAELLALMERWEYLSQRA